jgi:hypothetical protein
MMLNYTGDGLPASIHPMILGKLSSCSLHGDVCIARIMYCIIA